jgi:hypothetical protein
MALGRKNRGMEKPAKNDLKKMEKYAILQVEGGLGKNVMATAVVRSIAAAHPERRIVVVTAYPDIWDCNPRIYRAISYSEMSYFHQDYVQGKDSIFFLHDPYRQTDYINRTKHLTETWCELCGVEWSGEKPELYFTRLESEFVESIISKDRPILLMHPFGGFSGKYSWARDLHPKVAQDLADHFSSEYRVLQARREDQILLERVETLTMNPRQLALAMLQSDKRLLIDSYLQHVSAALGLKSTVVWIGNSPKTLGYQTNDNICFEFERGSIRNSAYEPFDILGNPIQVATPPDIFIEKKKIIDSLS